MYFLESAKVGNRLFLQLPIFSPRDNQFFAHFSSSTLIFHSKKRKKYKAWKQDVKHSNFTKHTKYLRLICVKSKKDSTSLTNQQDQTNDITKNTTEMLTEIIGDTPIVANTVY